MRWDLKDVIVNTGRSGAIYKGRGPKRWGEDSHAWEPMRDRRDGGWTRRERINDRTAPLRRWLLSQCGRPWSKVWAEVCAVADGRTLRGNHMRDHVKQYVAEVVVFNELGQPCRPHGSRWGRRELFIYLEPVYVHPRTGLLCRTPPATRYRKREQTAEERMVAMGIKCIAGIWYHAWYEKTTQRVRFGERVEYRDDVVERRRQLNAKELRRYGLAS